MTVNIQVEVSWVVMSCNVVVGYQCLEIHATSIFRYLSQHYMASQPRRHGLKKSVLLLPVFCSVADVLLLM
jgi:hypothetical protein